MKLFTLQNKRFDTDKLSVVLDYKFENIEPLDVFRSNIPNLILPATPKNNILLRNFGQIEANDLEPLDIYVMDSNSVKYDGRLHVREIVIENNSPKSYICYIIGKELDILTDLEGTLADLEQRKDYQELKQPSFEWFYREQADYTFPFNQWNYRTPFPFDPPLSRDNYLKGLSYSYGNSQTPVRLIPTGDYFQPNDEWEFSEAPRKWWINNIDHLYSNSHLPIEDFAFYLDLLPDILSVKSSEYRNRVTNEILKEYTEDLGYNQPFSYYYFNQEENSENFIDRPLFFPTKLEDEPNGLLRKKLKRHTESAFGYSVKETISEIFKQKTKDIPDDKINVDFTEISAPFLDLNFYKFDKDLTIDLYDLDNYSQFNGYNLIQSDLAMEISNIPHGNTTNNTRIQINLDGSDRSGSQELFIGDSSNLVNDNFVVQRTNNTADDFYSIMSKHPIRHHWDINLGNTISFTKNTQDNNYILGGGNFSNQWEFRIIVYAMDPDAPTFDYELTEIHKGEWITYEFEEYSVQSSVQGVQITVDDIIVPVQFKTAAEFNIIKFGVEARPTVNCNFKPRIDLNIDSAAIILFSEWSISPHSTNIVERSDLPYIIEGFMERISSGQNNLFPNEVIPTTRFNRDLFTSDKPVRDFIIDFLKLFNLSLIRVNNTDGTVTFKFFDRINVIKNKAVKIKGNDDYRVKVLEPIQDFTLKIGDKEEVFTLNKNNIRKESVTIGSDILDYVKLGGQDYTIYPPNFHGFVLSELKNSEHGNITPTWIPDGNDLFVRSSFRNLGGFALPPQRQTWSEYYCNSNNPNSRFNIHEIYQDHWKNWVEFLDNNRKEVIHNIYGDLALFNELLVSRICDIKGGLYLLRNIKLDLENEKMTLIALKINKPLIL